MSSDWWARKLGNPAPSAPATPPVPAPAPRNPYTTPMAPVPQQYSPAPVQAPQAQPESLSEYLATATHVSDKAQASRAASQCPGCNGGNFFNPPQGKPHCFDCGYPLIQSGSGMGDLAGAKTTGPAQLAKSPTYSQQLGR